MPVIWNESLSVGNDHIDQDHKQLIKMVNQVEESLNSDYDIDEIIRVLHDLDNFTADHFRREERLMKKVNYPDYQRHYNEHQALLTRFTALKSDVIINLKKKNMLNESEALIDLLRRWFLDHVITEDLLLKSYLKKYPPDFT